MVARVQPGKGGEDKTGKERANDIAIEDLTLCYGDDDTRKDHRAEGLACVQLHVSPHEQFRVLGGVLGGEEKQVTLEELLGRGDLEAQRGTVKYQLPGTRFVDEGLPTRDICGKSQPRLNRIYSFTRDTYNDGREWSMGMVVSSGTLKDRLPPGDTSSETALGRNTVLCLLLKTGAGGGECHSVISMQRGGARVELCWGDGFLISGECKKRVPMLFTTGQDRNLTSAQN